MAGSNIFDTLSKEPLERFVLTYTDNLTAIYEYDSCEIHEFLTSLKVDTEAQKRDILFNLRKCLHEKLCEFFPDSYDELYNRKKASKLVNDIYIIGHSVVNKMEDKRLKTVYKKLRGNDLELSLPVVTDDSILDDHIDENNTHEVVNVCIQLKVTVKDLCNTVNRLQDDIKELTARLEDQPNQRCPHCVGDPRNTPAAHDNPPRDNETPPRDNETPPSDNVPAPEQAAAQTDEAEATAPGHREEVNGHQSPGSVDDPNDLDDQHQSDSNTNAETATQVNRPTVTESQQAPTDNTPPNSQSFTLPQRQRKQAKQGRLFTVVNGSATRQMSISGINNANRPSAAPKSVYVGKLAESTTPDSLRKHLREEGINDVVDVIDLRCKIQGRSSFCIIVESQQSETTLYDPNIWPLGAKIRQYKERTQNSNLNNSRQNGLRQSDNSKPPAKNQRNQVFNRTNGPQKPQVDRKLNSGTPKQSTTTQCSFDGSKTAWCNDYGNFAPLQSLPGAVYGRPFPTSAQTDVPLHKPFYYPTQNFFPTIANRFAPLMDLSGASWIPTRVA